MYSEVKHRLRDLIGRSQASGYVNEPRPRPLHLIAEYLMAVLGRRGGFSLRGAGWQCVGERSEEERVRPAAGFRLFTHFHLVVVGAGPRCRARFSSKSISTPPRSRITASWSAPQVRTPSWASLLNFSTELSHSGLSFSIELSVLHGHIQDWTLIHWAQLEYWTVLLRTELWVQCTEF